jgi:F-type H+-transporting ATPase subunit a
MTDLMLVNLSSVVCLCSEISSPLDQFEIRNFFNLEAPILGYFRVFVTNIGFYLVIGLIIIISWNLLANNYNKLIGNR